MDYKNFLLRFVFSILIVSVYLIISLSDFEMIFYLISVIYFLILVEVILYFKILRFWLLIYLFLSYISIFNINFILDDFIKFNYFIMTIIIFDIFSYFFGKIFGKTKILSVSPNKTLEGFIGGIITSYFCCLLYSIYFNFKINLILMIVTSLIIIFAFIGDLIESFFKRKNNLKNSSNFIPGHGGVFDRFDSFLFSIIIYSFSSKFLL
tara:strand:- start:1118 stop:1741 length:624 start_codon:yes stop_codon:yes gene_type:complete